MDEIQWEQSAALITAVKPDFASYATREDLRRLQSELDEKRIAVDLQLGLYETVGSTDDVAYPPGWYSRMKATRDLLSCYQLRALTLSPRTRGTFRLALWRLWTQVVHSTRTG